MYKAWKIPQKVRTLTCPRMLRTLSYVPKKDAQIPLRRCPNHPNKQTSNNSDRIKPKDIWKLWWVQLTSLADAKIGLQMTHFAGKESCRKPSISHQVPIKLRINLQMTFWLIFSLSSAKKFNSTQDICCNYLSQKYKVNTWNKKREQHNFFEQVVQKKQFSLIGPWF